MSAVARFHRGMYRYKMSAVARFSRGMYRYNMSTVARFHRGMYSYKMSAVARFHRRMYKYKISAVARFCRLTDWVEFLLNSIQSKMQVIFLFLMAIKNMDFNFLCHIIMHRYY